MKFLFLLAHLGAAVSGVAKGGGGQLGARAPGRINTLYSAI